MPSVDLFVEVVVEPEFYVVKVVREQSHVDLFVNLQDPTVRLTCGQTATF